MSHVFRGCAAQVCTLLCLPAMARGLHKVCYAGRRLFRVRLRPARVTVAKSIISDVREQASREHCASDQVEETLRYQLAVAGCSLL